MTTIYCLCFVSSSTGPLSAQVQAPFRGKSKEWLKIGNEQRGDSFLFEMYYFFKFKKYISWNIFDTTWFFAVVQHQWNVFPPPVQLYLRGRLDTNYAFMLTVVESLSLSLTKTMHWCHWVIESYCRSSSIFCLCWTPFFNCLKNKFITINPLQQAAGVLQGVSLTGPPLNLLRVGQ